MIATLATVSNSRFTPEQEGILTNVESRLAAGYLMGRAAAESGVRAGDIDRLLNRVPIGRFSGEHGETEAALKKLADWLADIEREQHKNASPGFAETPTFKRIQAIIADAHARRKLAAITGGVGIGKSDAASAYVAAHPRTWRNPGAVRIEFGPSERKPAAALAAILAALRGMQGMAYRNGQLEDAIAAACRPGDCLILDECNELQEAVVIVKSLHDRYKIPIVMIGNPAFGRSVFAADSVFAPLASRTRQNDFPITTEEDVDAFLSWRGVAGVAVRNAAVKLACRPGAFGGLRNLAMLFDSAQECFPGEKLTADLLRDVAKQYNRYGA